MAKKTPKAKDNPAQVEMVTLTLPKHLPKGLQYQHGPTPLETGWLISSKKGLKAFKELFQKGLI